MTEMPTALITGASRGIGLAIAEELASTHHLLLGGRDHGRLTELAKSFRSAEPFAADVRDGQAIENAAASIESLDVLVHSAGILKMGTIAELTGQDWQDSFEINVFAVAQLTRVLLPALRKAHGQVVAINSGSGYSSGAGGAIYSGTKFALRAFTDALRQEERPNGVRVSSIHPGRVATDMQQELHDWEGKEYNPGAWIQPTQVAKAVRLAVETTMDSVVDSLNIRPSGIDVG